IHAQEPLDLLAVVFLEAYHDGVLVFGITELGDFGTEKCRPHRKGDLLRADPFALGFLAVDVDRNLGLVGNEVRPQLVDPLNPGGLNLPKYLFLDPLELVKFITRNFDGNGLTRRRTVGFALDGDFRARNTYQRLANLDEDLLGRAAV